jgi:amidophosphoribosyltransferase
MQHVLDDDRKDEHLENDPQHDDHLDNDHFHDECGVFGVFDMPDAAAHVALGLHALQHRGQEAAGVVTCDGTQFHTHKALGLVGDNFNKQHVIDMLTGRHAIGHNRYSTSGGKPHLRNVQPLFAEFAFGGLALAHNGNLTNAYTLRDELVQKNGAIFQSTSDTEVIVHLVAHHPGKTIEDRLVGALKRVEGAYSLVALANDRLIGVRDPFGVRPLVLGKVQESYVLASETVALDIIGADYVRDVEPGEMVIINAEGLQSHRPFDAKPSRFCVFEYIYFARPDSKLQGHNVYNARREIGAQLAREHPVEADLVVPVPDSGVPAAIGYAHAAGLPFELGIIRNHYVGRTFIEPTDQVRHLGVKLKHNANRSMLEGKRVVLVDDSIVRGTTSKKILNMVRDAGAKEIHMRIASPPTTHSCFYGVDTPEREKLLAARMDIEGMCKHIEADSLAFITMDGVCRALGLEGRDPHNPPYCDACFTGEYPIELTDANRGIKGGPGLDLFSING